MKKKGTKKSRPTPQYGDIVKKLDKIDNKQQEHDSILFKLGMGLETVKSWVGTIDTKVDRIEKYG